MPPSACVSPSTAARLTHAMHKKMHRRRKCSCSCWMTPSKTSTQRRKMRKMRSRTVLQRKTRTAMRQAKAQVRVRWAGANRSAQAGLSSTAAVPTRLQTTGATSGNSWASCLCRGRRACLRKAASAARSARDRQVSARIRCHPSRQTTMSRCSTRTRCTASAWSPRGTLWQARY
jgi:hypothetical protein